MTSQLELYEPLDIIGNGSFGIIRKVRRKSDGVILARKELNFERMSERDRKQIVAEVNILKDLHHEHIVRYHDRHIDRDAGILYILMEYCGGGDLSSIIKQAQKHNRPIPEDTIWNYLMQILLALHYCHHPNGHGRSNSNASDGGDGKERRPQILHRDLKPDNVFLSESNTVKLGDFGLSKALAQASFANTYVGTPYYMSPELMQEKAYDSKSDIWSLGCLVYELCALKPPFHEAKTHAELSIFIRNGRIPPLPRGYSQSLSGIIKSMLNLNPAMRPSAAQLLQHERLDLAFKVSETEKMILTVKNVKATVLAKEREVAARESLLAEKETHLQTLLASKDAEITSLQTALRTQIESINAQIAHAVSLRETSLKAAVAKREEEVGVAMQRREEEILASVRKREVEINEAWVVKEKEIREEMKGGVEERMEWVRRREEELKEEGERLEGVKAEVEGKLKALEEASAKMEKKGRKEKTPFEEVKNILAPLSRLKEKDDRTPTNASARHKNNPSFETPLPRSIRNKPSATLLHPSAPPGSAMKGVVLTATGQPLATPTPAELAKLFFETPKIGLNFTQIFDSDSETEEVEGEAADEGDGVELEFDTDEENEPPTPSKEPVRRSSECLPDIPLAGGVASESLETHELAASAPSLPPTRLRRPSIRRAISRTSLPGGPATQPAASSSSSSSNSNSDSTQTRTSSRSSASRSDKTIKATRPAPAPPAPSSLPAPDYDFSDEDALPSPFLKKIDREKGLLPKVGAGSTTGKGVRPGKRPSNANLLRAVAAANSANAAASAATSATLSKGTGAGGKLARPSVASARKASEEARKALSRS
ncbi:hypothetical protein JAAARDRAFT_195419 [Jaapia argillacea MUCL 33604]|uniref:non-specific serine/threonine protein kinase n=1 Tax=Jaapia argillacea MUCL 33604 TaxID=933084 RepID=A0A067PWB8_9AGAM|nr:hypothetical protein JAAARDRAFT_195419 [Jaapia argillacea MUCL 33604]